MKPSEFKLVFLLAFIVCSAAAIALNVANIIEYSWIKTVFAVLFTVGLIASAFMLTCFFIGEYDLARIELDGALVIPKSAIAEELKDLLEREPTEKEVVAFRKYIAIDVESWLSDNKRAYAEVLALNKQI